MSKRWIGLLILLLFIVVVAVSLLVGAQAAAAQQAAPLAWREAIFAILITAVVLAGLVGYEYVRKRKAE